MSFLPVRQLDFAWVEVPVVNYVELFSQLGIVEIEPALEASLLEVASEEYWPSHIFFVSFEKRSADLISASTCLVSEGYFGADLKALILAAVHFQNGGRKNFQELRQEGRTLFLSLNRPSKSFGEKRDQVPALCFQTDGTHALRLVSGRDFPPFSVFVCTGEPQK